MGKLKNYTTLKLQKVKFMLAFNFCPKIILKNKLQIILINLYQCFTMQNSQLNIISYTGAGITEAMKNDILKAIDNAYKIYRDTNYPGQSISISNQLTANYPYRFSVLLTSYNPSDSWFSIKTIDDQYAIQPGVNQIQMNWTYLIFANGQKGDNKSQNDVYYWNYGVFNVGKGISQNQKSTIINQIVSLESQLSCTMTGNQLGKKLSKLDGQQWDSFCRANTDKPTGGYLITQNQEYLLGQGNKCNCILWCV